MMKDLTNLSEYLGERKQTILENWRTIAKRDDVARQASRLTYEDFLDDVPHLLNVFCTYLDGAASSEALDVAISVVRRHGRERWMQDFNLEELLHDWGNLNQVVLGEVNRFFDELNTDARDDRAEAIRVTSVFFTEAICASVARFDELQREEALGKVEELEQMRRYVEQIGEARRRFLSDVSHDIGGSLTAISGVSELLKEGVPVSDESSFAEFGGIIDSSVVEATRVLDTLLQLTHFDAGKVQFDPERIHIGEFLAECVESFAEELGTDVSLKIEPTGGFEAVADPAKLRRTVEVMLDYAAADSCGSPPQLVCARGEDSWTLELRFHKSSAGEDGSIPASEHRRELDRLLLKRFCLTQNATCKIPGEDGGDEAEVAIVIRFP